MAKIDYEGLLELRNAIRGPIYLIREKLKDLDSSGDKVKYSEFKDAVEDLFNFVEYVNKNWDIRSQEDAFD